MLPPTPPDHAFPGGHDVPGPIRRLAERQRDREPLRGGPRRDRGRICPSRPAAAMPYQRPERQEAAAREPCRRSVEQARERPEPRERGGWGPFARGGFD